jgi:2-polyprenyl-3-methyl-5-hydroxy-6-metoxy-1,4-benzoquinol methylase
MQPTEIGLAYNQITHLWQDLHFNRHNGIEAHQRAIALSRHRGAALDIGCGCTGRLIDLLLTSGFQPEGIDISSEMVRLAQIQHPAIRFQHADICSVALSQPYDFITAWDSIWHIPLQQQQETIIKIINSLSHGGVFIFSFGCTTDAEEHIDNTMGTQMYYSSLGSHGFLNILMSHGCIIRHLEQDQFPELHGYIIAEKI